MSNAFRTGLVLLVALMSAGLLIVARNSDGEQGPPVLFSDYPAITPRSYVCYLAEKAPVIDGKLGDPAWQAVPWSDDFVDIEGDKKPRPRQRTRMKMMWDDDYLYIAAQLDETHVWGTLTKHDSVIFQDNDFEVFLDPDGDSLLYAELELNALNTTWDLLLPRPYKDGGKAIDGWEIPGLKTAVHVDGTLNDPRDADQGWSVEIAWPWLSLRELSYSAVPPNDGDQWRINFSRVEWEHEIVEGKYHKVKGKPEDNWVWSPQGVIDMHRPERWGIVQFSTAKPDTAKPRPDPGAEARHTLHRVLYAQREYHKAKGRWATKLSDLKLTGDPFEAVLLETTSKSFEASVPAGGARRWRIRSDGRFWNE
jgi:hypothetical protein